MTVAIVNTGIGNFGSIANAVRRAGANPVLADTASLIEMASHIILPGVGSFDSAVRILDERRLRPVLKRRAINDGVPVLGICLGMQILGVSSEEGQLAGLGWLSGRTVRLASSAGTEPLRVPHIGWNSIDRNRPSSLLEGINGGGRFYYVHSYQYVGAAEEDIVATTTYGQPFVAVIRHKSIVGTQFHPERSGPDGQRLIENFLRLNAGD